MRKGKLRFRELNTQASHRPAAGRLALKRKWVPLRPSVSPEPLCPAGEPRTAQKQQVAAQWPRLTSEEGCGARARASNAHTPVQGLVDICTYLHKLERAFEEKKVMK